MRRKTDERIYALESSVAELKRQIQEMSKKHDDFQPYLVVKYTSVSMFGFEKYDVVLLQDLGYGWKVFNEKNGETWVAYNSKLSAKEDE